MVLELRNVDQLALSLFDKEATYDAGPAGWLAVNACSLTGFEGMAQMEDETVDDREGVTGTEMPTSQEILKKGWALEYTENRLRPNTLAGLAALHFGAWATKQETGKTAYYHKIQMLEGGTATITANTIAFVDTNPDTITDSGNGFVAAGFKAGMQVIVSGSVANDGVYIVDTVVAGTLTLAIEHVLTAGVAGPAVTITALGLPSIGAIYKQAGSQYQAKGIKSDVFTLKLNAGFFALTSSLVGSGTRATDTTAFPAKITEAWLKTGKIAGAWVETGANISIPLTQVPTQGAENISSATPDDLTVRLLDFTFTHNNNLRKDLGYIAGGGDVRSELEFGRREATVEMKVKALQTAWATEIGYYNNQDIMAMELHCDMGTLIDATGAYKYGFILIIPQIRLNPIVREVQDDFHVFNISGAVQDNGTNPPVLMYVYNAQSAYLA